MIVPQSCLWSTSFFYGAPFFFSFVWLLLFVHFNNVWSFCDLYIWRLCYAGRLLFREIYIYLQNCLNIDVYNIIQLYFSHTVTYKGIILYFHGSEDRMTFLGICKRAVFVHWFNTFYRYRNLQRVLYSITQLNQIPSDIIIWICLCYCISTNLLVKVVGENLQIILVW